MFFKYIFIQLCTDVCMYVCGVCMHIFLYVCMFSMHVYIRNVCMYIDMNVCVCLYLCI